jgi:phosphomannomutase
MNRIEAVLFDLDGTLVDSQKIVAKSIQTTLGFFDIHFSNEIIAANIKQTLKDSYQALVCGEDVRKFCEKHNEIQAELLPMIETFTGVRETLEELEKIALAGDFLEANKQGSLEKKDIWDDFVNFSRSFVDVKLFKPLKVVMDAGNGMGGLVAQKVFANLGLDITPLCFEPDGTFPNHQANPFEEKNRTHWVEKVKEIKPDFGVAWDADCDRVYFLDENGEFINGDFIIALLAINFLEKYPKAGVVYDLRASWMVRDWLTKLGGTGFVERVGHTYIKKRMQETSAVFGGEVSGHYYFIKNAYMENGFVPALIIMEMISKTGKSLSQLIRDLGDYYVSGEINFTVRDVQAKLLEIREKYQNAQSVSEQDGLSFEFADWHFNVRPSANDPVLRLNLEAKSQESMEEKLKEIKKIISE